MIDYEFKELFGQDSVGKQLFIDCEGGRITNSEIHSESFELTESLCSSEELRFGSCEAGVVKFKMANIVESLKDKWLTISETLNRNTDAPFQIGKYKVYSDVPSGDRKYRNITAYDAMYDIINTDVAEWYESLTFPMTLKEFRDSFFAWFGIEQEDVSLLQDDMIVEKTIEANVISGKEVITAICELNGTFGHINRQGKFTYISLEKNMDTYPSYELYPSNLLFPVAASEGEIDSIEKIPKSRYISCEYEDFETEFVSKLQIRQEKDDIGVIAGDGSNTYIVENNFLVYGKGTDELSEIASRLLDKIKVVQYRPYKAALKGNLCLEVGDTVIFHTRHKEVRSYVLERTLKGIQSLRDTFQAKGVLEYSEKVNSIQRDVKNLKGKTNVLERTIEETRSLITDEENGLQTQITQNAESISSSVKEIREKMDGLQHTMSTKISELSDSVKIEIEQTTKIKDELQEVTESTKKTQYEFSTEDFVVSKSGSEMETHISDDGMRVLKNSQNVLVANNQGVEATNLQAKTYLIVGKNSRFEDFGSNRTGCFWIGN